MTFESSEFNSTETKPYFVNPECFGDDVARAFRDRLTKIGLNVEAEPCPEDWGWELEFWFEGHRYALGFNCEPATGEEDVIRPNPFMPGQASPATMLPKREIPLWKVIVTRRPPILRRLFRLESTVLELGALTAVHAAVTAMPSTTEVRWYDGATWDRGSSQHYEEPDSSWVDVGSVGPA